MKNATGVNTFARHCISRKNLQTPFTEQNDPLYFRAPNIESNQQHMRYFRSTSESITGNGLHYYYIYIVTLSYLFCFTKKVEYKNRLILVEISLEFSI